LRNFSYSLQNYETHWLIGNILNIPKFKNSCIDGYVYFTPNLTSRIPGSDLDWSIWTPAYKGDDKEELSIIINKIGEKWCKYENILFHDENAPFIQTENNDILKNMKLIPKNYYKS
jgi:hypothetical protein